MSCKIINPNYSEAVPDEIGKIEWLSHNITQQTANHVHIYWDTL